jgi:hypothetical protein
MVGMVALFASKQVAEVTGWRAEQPATPVSFFEYLDPSVSDTAVAGLNNLRIGDKTLTVRRTIPKAEMNSAGMGVGVDG